MEKLLKNYLSFWSDKNDLAQKLNTNLRKTIDASTLKYLMLVSGSVCVPTFSMLFLLGSGLSGLYAVVTLISFFLGIYLYNRKKEKNLKLIKNSWIEIFRKELFISQNLNVLFSFLVPYVEKNLQPQYFQLKSFIVKIEHQNFTDEDLVEFIELNDAVHKQIAHQKRDESATDIMKLFLKKNEIVINTGIDYEKSSVKEKYLQML